MYIKSINSIKPPPLPIKRWIFRKLYELTKVIKMNSYEHTFIAKQDVSDTQAKNLISKYQEIIKTNAGEILKVEEWGLRTLSHKIKKNKKGIYFHIKLNGEGKTIHELEKAENIDDSLIRYLTIKVKKHDLEKNYFEKKDL